jgi:hypothetical protein
MKDIQALSAKADSPEMQEIISAVGNDWSSQLVQEKIGQYRQTVRRGILQAQDAVESSAIAVGGR